MSAVFFTPLIGFPDLEAKIAYGLARVGIEAGAEVCIVPHPGFYEVKIYPLDGKDIDLNTTFYMLLKRILSSQKNYDLGVKDKDRKKYMTVDESKQIFKERLNKLDLDNLYGRTEIKDYVFTKEKACGHSEYFKFGATKEDKKQLGGLIFLASTHAGKPQFRDDRKRDLNLGLCEACGYLNILGKESFSFEIQLGTGRNRKSVWVLPIIRRRLDFLELTQLFSAQKTLRNFWLSDLLPLRTFTIGLLAKVPSLSDLVRDLRLSFHVSLLSKDRRGDTVVEQAQFTNTMPFSKFISHSPYNSAIVNNLLGTTKNPPKVAPLLELTNLLERPILPNLSKFARLYVQETSTKNFTNLLYSETSIYLLKEVGMIKEDIIKNRSVRSVAKTLGYFVWNKDYQNYSFADGLRNAKTAKEIRYVFEKLEREAKLRYDQEVSRQQGNPPHLPHPDDIEEINHLMQVSDDSLEQVKTTLYLLAFSWESFKTIRLE
jgi:CRISPR type I-A-associated protein Csa5